MNLFKNILLTLCLYPILTIAVPKTKVAPVSIKGAITVSAEESIKLIISNPKLVVIDARKEIEYMKGHIESAINILNTEMNQRGLTSLIPDKSTAILFYCNGPLCLRSSDAATRALSWGYTNVFWFRGGWKEWQEKRYPIVVGE